MASPTDRKLARLFRRAAVAGDQDPPVADRMVGVHAITQRFVLAAERLLGEPAHEVPARLGNDCACGLQAAFRDHGVHALQQREEHVDLIATPFRDLAKLAEIAERDGELHAAGEGESIGGVSVECGVHGSLGFLRRSFC